MERVVRLGREGRECSQGRGNMFWACGAGLDHTAESLARIRMKVAGRLTERKRRHRKGIKWICWAGNVRKARVRVACAKRTTQ